MKVLSLFGNYTSCLSNSQRYKSIGNGWTIDVVSHIFKQLKTKEEDIVKD